MDTSFYEYHSPAFEIVHKLFTLPYKVGCFRSRRKVSRTRGHEKFDTLDGIFPRFSTSGVYLLINDRPERIPSATDQINILTGALLIGIERFTLAVGVYIR
jgi:hypothetical protein